MEDISSKSKKFKLKDPVDIYGKLVYNRIGKIIKVSSYWVAILTVIVGLCAAFLIFKRQAALIVISFAVVLVFAVIGVIEFFIIYGLGHVIQQNNEILKRLNWLFRHSYHMSADFFELAGIKKPFIYIPPFYSIFYYPIFCLPLLFCNLHYS